MSPFLYSEFYFLTFKKQGNSDLGYFYTVPNPFWTGTQTIIPDQVLLLRYIRRVISDFSEFCEGAKLLRADL